MTTEQGYSHMSQAEAAMQEKLMTAILAGDVALGRKIAEAVYYDLYSPMPELWKELFA